MSGEERRIEKEEEKEKGEARNGMWKGGWGWMKGGEAVGKFVVYVPKTICCTAGKVQGLVGSFTFRLGSRTGLSKEKRKQTGGNRTTHYGDNARRK